MYILYKAYDRGGTQSIAYESGIAILILLLYINISSIIGLFGANDVLVPYNDSDSKVVQYLKTAIVLASVYIVLALLFKKKDIKNLEFEKRKIRKGYFFLTLCGVITLVLAIASTFRNPILYLLSR